MTGLWRIRVDVGGTFTDCVAIDPTGGRRYAKVLSSGVTRISARRGDNPNTWTLATSDPAEGHQGLVGSRVTAIGTTSAARVEAVAEDGAAIMVSSAVDWPRIATLEFSTGEPPPVLAARLVTGMPCGQPLPPHDFRLATTRATNALLTGDHPRCVLFITEGFSDLLEIRNQRRPDVYARSIRKPPPITDWTIGIRGRAGPDVSVVDPLDTDTLRVKAREAVEAGATTAAVCLIGAWANPEMEREAAAICKQAGFQTVIASAELTPRVGLLDRVDAATIEASLEPVLGSYLDEVGEALQSERLSILKSTGGLTAAESFRPVDGLLSGPAGGLVGAAAVARACGFERAISFDMGGTSTDVARIEGSRETAPSHRVGHVTIARRAVAIETVAAGGGSICKVVDGRATVGPESASADPGPACYGAGGPLTVTDVNLLMGRIDDSAFEIPIDRAAAKRAFDVFHAAFDEASEPIGRDELLTHLIDLANEHMAEAIRSVSIRRGYDPAAHAMVAFGGAGPQHACEIAERLGIETVLVPEHASLLSAVGLGSALLEASAEMEWHAVVDGATDDLEEAYRSLERTARSRLGIVGDTDTSRIARMRLTGQHDTIDIDASSVEHLDERFRRAYRRVHATAPDRAIEIAGLEVVVRQLSDDRSPPPGSRRTRENAARNTTRRVQARGGWVDATTISRCDLSTDSAIIGPAFVSERRTQTWVPDGWRCVLDEHGTLRLNHLGTAAKPVAHRPESLGREIVIHRLASIAAQMGDALRRAAVSVNIRDRLDFSCSVHDLYGRMVSSADHLPVHLGAMGLCVRRVLAVLGPLNPGDAALTNHPRFGGSHLPDLTVVQPVFTAEGERIGYVASRAHHAEIGGLTPGSMPPDARSLAEEGVPIPPRLIALHDEIMSDARSIFTTSRYPSRSPDDNLLDLGAAISAGARAADLIRELARTEGADRVRDAMTWIIGHTGSLVRERISELTPHDASVVEEMDGGATIRVRVVCSDDGMTIDFTGSSPTQRSNLNAPLAVTRSAVSYVVRLLLNRPLPLNDGLLDPIDIVVPEGSFLNPAFSDEDELSPAVAGGNVETSQRVTEALLRVFGLIAGGAGTMNNVLIGAEDFGTYETIGSGAGATADADGADGVHQHMSNTAITDAEILEHRHPLRVRRFAIRRGSGGAGVHRGGDGLIREIEALTRVTASFITQRRTAGAPGADGGEAGRPGVNRVRRRDGQTEALDSAATQALEPGDRLLIETPGGGGWGRSRVDG